MSENQTNDQMPAYSEAVKSGLYAKKTGLVGKYDNVRRYWEDELTRNSIRPFLQKLIEKCWSQMRRLRILDLGCGSADGFELLHGIRDREADLHDTEVELLQPDALGLYKGVDLNQDLLDQARSLYGDDPKMVFEQGNFTEGLPVGPDEKPYDLYFTSYGTFSHHNDDETAIQLLQQIAAKTEDYSVVVADWLGRYSYEWQSLWTNDLSENRNMDYVVSYIYEKEEREARRDELQHLDLRLMSRAEVNRVVVEAGKRAEADIRVAACFDRSVLTGRHMDTADYNPHAQPLRRAVNSLHEDNQRTDLGSLTFDFVPKPGFELLCDFFEHLQGCWNALVRYSTLLLTEFDEEKREFKVSPPEIPASYPEPLREMMTRMRDIIEGVGWVGTGLPRENIIEPQLGYALRHLVYRLQQGRGCGHGLVCILEINK